MKLSFDEEHRHAMCQLGGLHAVAELIQVTTKLSQVKLILYKLNYENLLK